jgi:deazaflavin-dependent oxidoreductase (nitroreductase family)
MALEAEMSGTLFGRASDVVVRTVLRSPLHGLLSRRLLIITVTGRRTGRRYSNPVGYAQHDGALLVGSVAGWRRNLRPGEPVPVRLRGADVSAEAEVITDEERAAEFYRVILPRNPIHARYAGIHTDPDGQPNRADLRRALSAGAAVIRLTVRD